MENLVVAVSPLRFRVSSSFSAARLLLSLRFPSSQVYLSYHLLSRVLSQY